MSPADGRAMSRPMTATNCLLPLSSNRRGQSLPAIPRETAKISEGKVDGEKIFFNAAITNATFTYEGTIAGDEIKVTVKVPDFPPSDITLNRFK
jgi:hypothetical protein